MKTIRASVLICVPLLLVTWASVAAIGSSYEELELSWDDGSAEGGFAMLDGARLAVGFYAPETALAVTGMRVYIKDHEVDPHQPSTVPFTAWVLRVGSEGGPGVRANSGYLPLASDPSFPENTWVDILFPEPIDISDEGHFPGHKFYVELEFEFREGPTVGLDLDPPFSGETYYSDWNSWAVVDTADAMMRAVVSDTSGVPVELESWGRVKSEYR